MVPFRRIALLCALTSLLLASTPVAAGAKDTAMRTASTPDAVVEPIAREEERASVVTVLALGGALSVAGLVGFYLLGERLRRRPGR